MLAGCGLQDTINYPLISEGDNARLLAAAGSGEGWTEAQATAGYLLPSLLRPADSVQLANPLSVERSLLRSSLLLAAGRRSAALRCAPCQPGDGRATRAGLVAGGKR